jgi:hypothetical protein
MTVCEDKVLKRTFRGKNEKVTLQLKNAHDEALCNMHLIINLCDYTS